MLELLKQYFPIIALIIILSPIPLCLLTFRKANDTKKRLKSIGITLLFLGLIFSFLGPFFLRTPVRSCPPSERAKVELRNENNTYLVMLISGISLGAGLALLITGYSLKEKETHNEENSTDGLQPPQI